MFFCGLLLGAAAAWAVGAALERRRRQRLGRFLSHAAHEINTPITAINITVLNLLSGVFGPIPPDQLKWIEMMREQLGRLNGMVGDLRDFIHLSLNRDLLIRSDSVDPREIITEAVALAKRGSDRSDIVADVPAALPQVCADRDRMVRILSGLLFHARKFRASGDLRLSAQPAPGAVLVRVSYLGQAIPASEVACSLELLYPSYLRKGHTLNSVGLGLGVHRALVQKQGADLSFQVAPDGDSTLTLRLAEAVEGGRPAMLD
jgi:two-component system cell cycle sensor histidine kinase PleC